MKNKRKTRKLLLFSIPLLLLSSCGGKQNDASKQTAVPDPSVVKTAEDAYTFAIPLVLMDITRRQASDKAANPLAAAENTFNHMSVFPDADFRAVVRANADTYYSTAWLNLEKEPMVLSLPDTKGRYYMMPLMDAYTNVFASPGSRTTGNKPGNFLVTGPKWSGNVPENMQQIKSPTNMVWLIGRTQVNSKEDGDKVVVPLQKQYKLTPLSAWGKPYASPTLDLDANVPKGDPNEVVKNMPIDEFFNYAGRLMEANPPADADKAAVDKFAEIGVGVGKIFDLSKFTEADQTAIKQIPAGFFGKAGDFFSKPDPESMINGWGVQYHLGSYGTNYETRAFVAVGGLGANLPEDAIYPSCAVDAEGNKLTGTNNYVIRFDKGQTPPAKAFWSLTMYDPDGYMVKNPINRNVIGDRSNLKQNPDGSTDIYIQHSSPGKDKESNWLPAPEGDFNILLRIYEPKEEMINGTWKIPAVKKM